MKNLALTLLAALSIAAPAFAQETATAPTEAPWRAVEAEPLTGGDVRAPSPKIYDPERRGYFQVGAGPAFGMGFDTDALMYNVQGSYNFNLDDLWTIKALADAYMGAGSVSSRLINVGVGADVYAHNLTFMGFGLPYLTGELALGSGRDAQERTATGLAAGAGAGFKFQAQELNWDIGIHYTVLTQQIDAKNPSAASLRAAMTF